VLLNLFSKKLKKNETKLSQNKNTTKKEMKHHFPLSYKEKLTVIRQEILGLFIITFLG